MEAVVKVNQEIFATELEENDKVIRKMVMNSFQDMQEGKGRDYKEYFAELESRYRNANV